MKKAFEHLLGLSARDALAVLKSAGIFDVRVTYTVAPQSPRTAAAADPDESAKTTALEEIAQQFDVSEDEEENAYDPLLEPQLTDGMLTEARVIGIRDDGRQLIVSRFRVSPKPSDETAGDEAPSHNPE